MNILITLLTAVGILWFLDEILTIADVKKFGIRKEENPIVSWMVKHGPVYFTAFKIFTFVVFAAMIMIADSIHPEYAIALTAFIGLGYAFVVARNFEIYEDLI